MCRSCIITTTSVKTRTVAIAIMAVMHFFIWGLMHLTLFRVSDQVLLRSFPSLNKMQCSRNEGKRHNEASTESSSSVNFPSPHLEKEKSLPADGGGKSSATELLYLHLTSKHHLNVREIRTIMRFSKIKLTYLSDKCVHRAIIGQRSAQFAWIIKPL